METFKSPLEIWGGLECTVNRVGDSYVSQCLLNGHLTRLEDLETFARLGIKKIRYPVLWERVAPDQFGPRIWKYTDDRLIKLRDLGMTPIAGLCHHGSGPNYTSLLDSEFPEKLASYAKEVAERFPWLEWYTPVNEPLTTARFSCLYGVWYPHKRDDVSFGRALFHEVKATVLAMQAIRKVNPKAKLVQTDDLGQARGTSQTKEQVEFENHRRWITWDLLFGRVDKSHPFYDFMVNAMKVTESELAWLRDNACPPDIIGVNHYPLSNRFLDHRLELYPSWAASGNGRMAYADVGAVDTGQVVPPAPIEVLREVWERYKSPFAITEAHIAGGREQQMRWLKELWDSAQVLKAEGADIRAVTAWSLLGAYDWATLCTLQPAGQLYESGVFDVRAPSPRPTALARMIRSFADRPTQTGDENIHPVLERTGYWHEPLRIRLAPSAEPFRASEASPAVSRKKRPSRPIVITGATGTLGRAYARICESRGLDYKLLSRQEMDISSPDSVAQALKGIKPWALINTAGYVRVDDAEGDEDRCFRENTLGPSVLAEVCASEAVQLMTFSSDLVFGDHESDPSPWRESHQVAPLNVYGRSKAEAERSVLGHHPSSMVIRTSAFFGPWDDYNFMRITMNSLKRGEVVKAASDMVVSPTYVPDLVQSSLDLLIDGEEGLIHLTNNGALSWADWATWIAKSVGADPNLVVPCRTEDLGFRARRPKYSALQSERTQLMPNIETAFVEFNRLIG